MTVGEMDAPVEECEGWVASVVVVD